MYGVHLAHKIGDLVRIKKWHPNGHASNGSLGIVTQRPEDTQKSLFIKVYIFKTSSREVDRTSRNRHNLQHRRITLYLL